MTRQRTLSAAVMLALFVASLWVEALWWVLPVLIVAFGALCLMEIAQLISAKNLRFPHSWGLVFLLLLLYDGYAAGLRHGAVILAGSLIVLLIQRVLLTDYTNIAAEVGAAFLATAYIGLPMGMAAAISRMTDLAGAPVGGALLIYVAAVVFGGDSAAYFIGRKWGKTPFFPKISPKKTIEGAVASVAVSILLALIVTGLFPSLRTLLGFRHSLLLGVLLGLAAPLGDLAESSFKRDAAKKDSGNECWGHGGFLDMFDALLFGLPIQFGYVQLVLANLLQV